MNSANTGRQSTFCYVLRITLILLAITAIVAAALAWVNSVTKPVIDRRKAEKTQAAITAVLPGGGEAVAFSDSTGIVKNVYRGESGYAVEVAPQGFNGAIEMMVGIDTSGKVVRISIISQSETAGLGAVAAAQSVAGDAFRSQFAGASGNIAVTKDGGQIDAITGATITSRAVTNGVNAALECVRLLMNTVAPLA